MVTERPSLQRVHTTQSLSSATVLIALNSLYGYNRRKRISEKEIFCLLLCLFIAKASSSIDLYLKACYSHPIPMGGGGGGGVGVTIVVNKN